MFLINRRILATFSSLIFLASISAPAQSAKTFSTGDETALRQVTLTMDMVNRMYQTNEGFGTLAKQHPELKAELSNDSDSDSDNDQSIDASVRKFSAHTELVAVMKKNGFTAREYVVTGMALFTAAFAEATAKQNNIDPSKMAAQANINPANIAFVTQHHAELEAMQKKAAEQNKN